MLNKFQLGDVVNLQTKVVSIGLNVEGKVIYGLALYDEQGEIIIDQVAKIVGDEFISTVF